MYDDDYVNSTNDNHSNRKLSTVILRAEFDWQLINAILASGAGVLIIDENTLNRLNVSKSVTKNDENLIDASGNSMNVIDKVQIKVLINKSAYQRNQKGNQS